MRERVGYTFYSPLSPLVGLPDVQVFRKPTLVAASMHRVPGRSSEPMMLQAAARHAAKFFKGAVKPVMVVGAQLRSKRAQAAMIKLAEACGMPVAVMPNAKSFFPEDHPNFIGVFWVNISTPFCGETVTAADKYIFVGPVFNDVTTIGFTHPVLKDRLVDVQLDNVSIGTEGHYGRYVTLSGNRFALGKPRN